MRGTDQRIGFLHVNTGFLVNVKLSEHSLYSANLQERIHPTSEFQQDYLYKDQAKRAPGASYFACVRLMTCAPTWRASRNYNAATPGCTSSIKSVQGFSAIAQHSKMEPHAARPASQP